MAENTNCITCTKWIKRGVSKRKPEYVGFTKEELKGLLQKAKRDILETAEDLKNSEGSRANEDELNMEDYDKENSVDSLIGFGNLISIDENIEDLDQGMQDDEEDSEKEDEEIKPTDNLIAVGHLSGDVSTLEVYVFNEGDKDLYVHHDIILPTIPLCLEWLSSTSSSSPPGNLLALGGMNPEISVWDLDVVNCLEPVSKLGEFYTTKKYQHRNHGHRDAVLDLAWSGTLSHLLASGSVDRTLILWDLEKSKAITQFSDYKGKVQSLQWHPSEVNIIAAGSCDGMVSLADCRTEGKLPVAKVEGEVENVTWHPATQGAGILVGTSEGELCCLDCRTGKRLWSVKAHDKEVTGLAVHSDHPDRVVTCSVDQTVKVWNTSQHEPRLISFKQTNLGKLQSLQLCPENPDIVSVGGDSKSNNFKLYNISSDFESSVEEMEAS